MKSTWFTAVALALLTTGPTLAQSSMMHGKMMMHKAMMGMSSSEKEMMMDHMASMSPSEKKAMMMKMSHMSMSSKKMMMHKMMMGHGKMM